MAEYVNNKEETINVDEPIIFENKTEASFDVSVGVVFRKSGLYRVSVYGNNVSVQKEPERMKGRWNFIGDNMFECTCCGVVYTTQQLDGLRNYDTDPYAPKFCSNCGADMRGRENE